MRGGVRGGPGARLRATLGPAVVVVPVVLGLLRLAGERAGWFSREASLAMGTAATVVVLAALLLVVSVALDRAFGSQERVEQALAQRRAELELLLESLGEGVIVADGSARFREFNPRAVELLGLGASELDPSEWSAHYNLCLADGVTPFPPERLPLARALRGERVDGEEVLVRRPDLDRDVWILANARPLRDPDGTVRGGVAAFTDITERKQAEAGLKALNEELENRVVARTLALEESNRDLEGFAYSVSHDLRAPLRAVDGFSRILVEEHGSEVSGEVHHHLDRIRSNVARMGRLIDDLLLFSRTSRQALTLSDVDVEALVKGVVDEMSPMIEGRKVGITIDPLPDCRADVALLRIVFANLLGNALKFTRPRERAEIRIGFQASDGAVPPMFYVRDNGVGFDMRYASKLFGVFQRLHPSEPFEGSGVGLAMVERIIRRHGGAIWALGAPDEGATFSFTLDQPSPSGARRSLATGDPTAELAHLSP